MSFEYLNAPVEIIHDDANKVLHRLVSDHNASVQRFLFQFVTEDCLFDMNQQYLSHDTHTDIITFDYSTTQNIDAECFISIDRARENAEHHAVPYVYELYRLLLHAMLHCLGYNDSTAVEKRMMRKMEEKYLKLFHVEHKNAEDV